MWHPFYATKSELAELAESAAEHTARSRRRGSKEIRIFELRLGRALLACEAMWTILRDKLGVTEAELVQRINDLDLSDGQLDGKVRKDPVACPKCHKDLSPWLSKCPGCGEAVWFDPFA